MQTNLVALEALIPNNSRATEVLSHNCRHYIVPSLEIEASIPVISKLELPLLAFCVSYLFATKQPWFRGSEFFHSRKVTALRLHSSPLSFKRWPILHGSVLPGIEEYKIYHHQKKLRLPPASSDRRIYKLTMAPRPYFNSGPKTDLESAVNFLGETPILWGKSWDCNWRKGGRESFHGNGRKSWRACKYGNCLRSERSDFQVYFQEHKAQNYFLEFIFREPFPSFSVLFTVKLHYPTYSNRPMRQGQMKEIPRLFFITIVSCKLPISYWRLILHHFSSH